MFQYDPGASYLLTALRFSNTVVPSVVQRPTFWLFFILHIAIYVAYGRGLLSGADSPDSALYINWKIIGVITSMTTFFEVFYTNNIYSRYVRLYTVSKLILGAIASFAFDMRIHAGSEHKMVRLATHYMIASVFLFFHDLHHDNRHSGQEPQDIWQADSSWEPLLRRMIIQQEDKEILMSFPREHRAMILLHWSGRVLKEAVTAAKAPNNVLKGMVDRLMFVKDHQQQITDTLHLPMPFQYFHLLNMMVVVNLGLWAYGMGVNHSMFAPVGFFFSELIFCGMMELAGQLSDPFGGDDVDFPINEWLSTAIYDAVTVLEYEYTIGRGGWAEIAERCEPLRIELLPCDDVNTEMTRKGSRDLEANRGRRNSHLLQLSGQDNPSYTPLILPSTPRETDSETGTNGNDRDFRGVQVH